MDPIPNVSPAVPPVGPPIPTAVHAEVADDASGRATLLPTTQDFSTPPPASGGKLTAGKDVSGIDVDVNQGRKSKRPRTLSSKLDGRFHFDKKTKLLVGHPSPLLSAGEVVSDPEERYHRSLSKLNGKRFFDIIERKKHFTSKVMDALIKFPRHLLRTDDIDGEKLRVDVLGSNPPEDFIFPAALVDLLMGVGESDRVRLFAEDDCMYMPFNFDKKHWVALCVDLKTHKITIIDSNIQLRRASALYAELHPLAAMLPYLFKQANSSGGPILLQPFRLDRPHDIPQVLPCLIPMCFQFI
ncbi:putative Ulp1 protease family catalytic domain, papain-like cysteine peptidase superfamily [Arabidopsis thaliana]